MSIGEQIIDQIISGTLFTTRCSHDESHGCVTVWSSGAAEQIEATAQKVTNQKLVELVESCCMDFEKLNLKPAADLYREELRKITC